MANTTRYLQDIVPAARGSDENVVNVVRQARSWAQQQGIEDANQVTDGATLAEWYQQSRQGRRPVKLSGLRQRPRRDVPQDRRAQLRSAHKSGLGGNPENSLDAFAAKFKAGKRGSGGVWDR